MTVATEQGITQGKLCGNSEQVPTAGVLGSKECAYLVTLSSGVVFFAHEDPVIIAKALTLCSFAWSGEDLGVTFGSVFSGTVASCAALWCQYLTMDVGGFIDQGLDHKFKSRLTWPWFLRGIC